MDITADCSWMINHATYTAYLYILAIDIFKIGKMTSEITQGYRWSRGLILESRPLHKSANISI